MEPSLPPPSVRLTLQQLIQADEFTLLQLHREAEINHDDAYDGLIRAEVARRIKFDLIGSVAVYNAFVPPYRQTA